MLSQSACHDGREEAAGPPVSKAVRLLIADDEQLTRAGLTRLLCGSELEVAFHALTAAEAVRFSEVCNPDLVLLDVVLPDEDGFSALQQIKQKRPRRPVVMFSICDDLGSLAKARQLGADGFLSKSASRSEIIDTLRKAVSGRPAWSRSQIRSLGKKLSNIAKGDRNYCALTPRELEVVRRLALGLTNEDIAAELKISPETVRHHLERLFAKIAVTDRTQAAIWALREGLLGL